MFTESNTLEVLNFLLTLVTAISALYLAYAALKHSARPNADVFLLEPSEIFTNTLYVFKFSFINTGHWYSKPMIVNMTVFINFDESFEPINIKYGSIQEYKDNNVRIGKGNMKFLKAKGIKLSYGEHDEKIFVKTKSPSLPGTYNLKISAYSDNGLTLSKKFEIEVLRQKEENL
jgi:hypothetical protein